MKCVKITFQKKILGRSRVPCWSTYHVKTTCSRHYYPVDINTPLCQKHFYKVWVLTCHSIVFKTSVKWGMAMSSFVISHVATIVGPIDQDMFVIEGSNMIKIS